MLKVIHFSTDEQPELNLENGYPNKTGYNLNPNSSISVLQKGSDPLTGELSITLVINRIF